MDMFSLSREAQQFSGIDRKTSVAADVARKQSVYDRRASSDRRPSCAQPGFGFDPQSLVSDHLDHCFFTSMYVTAQLNLMVCRSFT
jgi:hypothetical protein